MLCQIQCPLELSTLWQKDKNKYNSSHTPTSVGVCVTRTTLCFRVGRKEEKDRKRIERVR